MDQLANAYDDPEDAERAVRRLGTLQQDGSFGKYLALFEKTLLQAGGMNWDDVVKKSMLARGLSEELQKALVATPTPASYGDYCTLLHTVSHNLESLSTKKRTEWAPRPKPQKEETSTPMEWEPTVAPVASTKSRTKDKKRPFVGKCYECGQDGHMARDCPKSSNESISPVRQAKSKKSKSRTKSAVTNRTKKEKAKKPPVSNSDSNSEESTTDGSGKEEL